MFNHLKTKSELREAITLLRKVEYSLRMKQWSHYVCDLVNEHAYATYHYGIGDLIVSEIRHRIAGEFSIGEWLRNHHKIGVGMDRPEFDRSDEMREYRIRWVNSMIDELTVALKNKL